MPTSHCFVIGCGRTGSTPLVHLLGAHPNVAMGMERYKFIVREMRLTKNPDLYTPALFEPERFLDYRPEDSNTIPPNFEGHYNHIRRRFDAGTVTMAGDKVMPSDTFTTLAIADHFPEARFIFVYRDLLSVASSFDQRAQNPQDTTWPERNDHELAFKQWTAAFQTVDALVAAVGVAQVFMVRSDRLFGGDQPLCDAMFGFLDLEVTRSVRNRLGGLCESWGDRQLRHLILDDAVQRSLTERIDHETLLRYDAQVTNQLPASGRILGRLTNRRRARSSARFEQLARDQVVARAAELHESQADPSTAKGQDHSVKRVQGTTTAKPATRTEPSAATDSAAET